MRLSFCAACGETRDLQSHHLVTRSEGGTNSEKNLLTLCYPCHALLHKRKINGVYSASERIKAGRATAKALGRSVSGQPSLMATKPEVTDRIAQLRTDDPTTTLRAISAVLADEGHFTSKGKPYSPTQIARILARASTERPAP